MNAPIGTTPTFSFAFDETAVDFTTVNHIYISMVTENFSVVKTPDDDGVVVSAHQIDVHLTQEETLAIGTDKLAMQVNWTYGDGNRAASTIVMYRFDTNLLDKVVE